MRVIRPTHFGNLVLDNSLSLHGRPGKRERLAPLWHKEAGQDDFQATFSPYRIPDENKVITNTDHLARWQQMGLVKEVEDKRPVPVIFKEIQLEAATNPIKHLTDVYIELTGLCNLNCRHCYRGGSRPDEFGLPVELIVDALKPLLMAGIQHIVFSGGESTLRIKDLLSLVDQIKDYLVLEENQDGICVMSNGTFADPEWVFEEINARNIEMQISLDSIRESITDKNRRQSGAFREVWERIALGKNSGVSLHVANLNMGSTFMDLMMTTPVPINRLGNAVSGGDFAGSILPIKSFGQLGHSEKHERGWCKGFTHPSTVHIRPNGNVGNCSFGYALPVEFGNLHEHDMTWILNNVHHSLPYRLFKYGAIESLQHEVDQAIFTGPFASSCEPIIITLLYAELKHIKMGNGLPEEQARVAANLEAAKRFKFLP